MDHQLLLNLANSIREERRERERERERGREREREGEREYSGQLYVGFHGCAVH